MAFLCGFRLSRLVFQGFGCCICSITLIICTPFSCNRFVAEMHNCHSKIVLYVTRKRWFMVRFLLFFDIFPDNSAKPENVWKMRNPWYFFIGIGFIVSVSIGLLFELQYLFKCCMRHEIKLYPVKVVRITKNNSEPLNIKGSECSWKLFFLCFHLTWTKNVVRLFCFVQSILYSILLFPFSMMHLAMTAGPGARVPIQTAHSAYLYGLSPVCRSLLPQM